jgi:hypothetical protein
LPAGRGRFRYGASGYRHRARTTDSTLRYRRQPALCRRGYGSAEASYRDPPRPSLVRKSSRCRYSSE